jgi:phosphopantothenoylcysteine decarboxylase/phosphopantothenate--cysteine ligase
MWSKPATARNLAQLAADGIVLVGPNEGEMAERGEAGVGRMAEPSAILEAIERLLGAKAAGPLSGRRVLITSGPTQEPIDPVRYIANRSSGKQGHALARAAVSLGADVTLVTGPVSLPDPDGARVVRVETAEEMLAAALASLPADIAICAAAVADWRAEGTMTQKLKKGDAATSLRLTENPDILATLARPGPMRPRLVIGFAAETENLTANASEKRRAKGADWIVANDVSPDTGVMGGDNTEIHLVTEAGVEDWPPLSKDETAMRLLARAAASLAAKRPAAE